MGTGIAAVIPIILEPPRSAWDRKTDKKMFSPSFFECYDVNEDGSVYTIKHEVLLHNYHSFLAEFYDCIEEDRLIVVGLSRELRVLTVVHCWREDDTIIRIISARKATQLEQKLWKR